MNEPEKGPREITVSRRTFFAITILGGFACSAVAVTSPKVQDALFSKLDEQPLSERVIAEASSNRRSIFRTIIETCLMWAGVVGVGELLDRLGVNHGGRAADGELYAAQAESAPIGLYFRDCIAIPVVEEAFFRLLPSSFFSEEQPPNVKMHWGTGFVSASLFAAIHNFSKPEEDQISFHFDSLPVEQFLLGTYCWWAQRKGGFLHSAGSHVLYNNLCEAYWQLYESKRIESEPVSEPSKSDD